MNGKNCVPVALVPEEKNGTHAVAVVKTIVPLPGNERPLSELSHFAYCTVLILLSSKSAPKVGRG